MIQKDAGAVKQVWMGQERMNASASTADFSDDRIRSSQRLQDTWTLDIIPLSLSCYVPFRILITSSRFSTQFTFTRNFVGYKGRRGTLPTWENLVLPVQ